MKIQLSLLASVALAGVTATDTAPEQVHIALAGQDGDGDPTGFTFAWFTQDTASSEVEYSVTAIDGTVTNGTANGTSTQYLDDHGYHHAVRATGWPADAKVTYRVGSDADGWSPYFSTRMAPDKDTDRTIKLSVFGDMGYSDSDHRKMIVTADGLVKTWSAEYSRQTLEALKNNGDIEMVWHVGDIGYADDAFAHDPVEFLYEKAYNGYMNWLQNLTSIMPYMVSVGNHESECHSAVCIAELKTALALSNFSAYNTRWRMPSEESGGHPGSNMWYSWNYGPVHFVSVNTETDFPGAGEERTGDSHFPWLKAGGFGYKGEYLQWVENDLKVLPHAQR